MPLACTLRRGYHEMSISEIDLKKTSICTACCHKKNETVFDLKPGTNCIK